MCPHRIAADSATCPSDRRTTAPSCCLAAVEILTPDPRRNGAALAAQLQAEPPAQRVPQEAVADVEAALQAELPPKVRQRTEAVQVVAETMPRRNRQPCSSISSD